MLESRIFQVTFLISLFAHGAILVQHANLFYPAKDKKEDIVEVNYLKKPAENKPQPKNNFAKRIKAEPFRKLPEKITVENKLPPPFIEKNNSPSLTAKPALALKADTNRPAFIQAGAVYLKKKSVCLKSQAPKRLITPHT